MEDKDLTCMVNTMDADDKPMQGAGALIAKMLM